MRAILTNASGSSPRGRGKPVSGRLGALCPRLIPARAGKTYFLNALPRRAWAHPRAGGENMTLLT